MFLKEHVKPEMHQSVVELGTEICSDTGCARQQVIELRSWFTNRKSPVAGTRHAAR